LRLESVLLPVFENGLNVANAPTVELCRLFDGCDEPILCVAVEKVFELVRLYLAVDGVNVV